MAKNAVHTSKGTVSILRPFEKGAPRLATLKIGHSTVIGNAVGLRINTLSPCAAISFGDNHIKGNGTDVQGTLTNVGTQ
jgi:hypothetical protein